MVKSRVIAKKKSKKQRTGKSGEAGTGGAVQETPEQVMERAHGLIARQDFDAAVTVLEGLLARGEDATARELIGVVECERGEVEKGREVSKQSSDEGLLWSESDYLEAEDGTRVGCQMHKGHATFPSRAKDGSFSRMGDENEQQSYGS